jgi:tetratricopeptide (TPR) repeat protein
MAKLIRCPAGHIYDSEAHASCPACARPGAASSEPAKAKTVKVVSPTSGPRPSPSFLPKPLMLIAGAGVAVLAVATLLLRPGAPSRNDAEQRQDPAFLACRDSLGDAAIAKCSAAIDSKAFGGAPLSTLYNNRGLAHLQKDELDAAVSDLSEAVRLDPGNATAFANLGRTYRHKGDLDQALANYGKAIAIDATNPITRFNRAIALEDKGEDAAALDDLNEAIKLDPKSVDGYWTRGDLLRKMGKRDAAVADYKQALALNPNDDARKSIQAELNALTGQ